MWVLVFNIYLTIFIVIELIKVDKLDTGPVLSLFEIVLTIQIWRQNCWFHHIFLFKSDNNNLLKFSVLWFKSENIAELGRD